MSTLAGRQRHRPADIHESKNLVQPTRTRRVLVTAQPSRVAVDETVVKINGEWSWLYAAIDLDTKHLLEVYCSRDIELIQLLRSFMQLSRNTSAKIQLYSIWRAMGLLVQVDLTDEYEQSPVVTANIVITLLKKQTGVK